MQLQFSKTFNTNCRRNRPCRRSLTVPIYISTIPAKSSVNIITSECKYIWQFCHGSVDCTDIACDALNLRTKTKDIIK